MLKLLLCAVYSGCLLAIVILPLINRKRQKEFERKKKEAEKLLAEWDEMLKAFAQPKRELRNTLKNMVSDQKSL